MAKSIKREQEVVVIAGAHKGKRGKVLFVKAGESVIVEPTVSVIILILRYGRVAQREVALIIHHDGWLAIADRQNVPVQATNAQLLCLSLAGAATGLAGPFAALGVSHRWPLSIAAELPVLLLGLLEGAGSAWASSHESFVGAAAALVLWQGKYKLLEKALISLVGAMSLVFITTI